MITYFVYWTTNYGLGAAIITCASEDELKIICKNSKTIWDDYDFDIITGMNGIEHLQQSI